MEAEVTEIKEFDLPHVAERLFNEPLLIEPGKLSVILNAVAPRILSGEKLEEPYKTRVYGSTIEDGIAIIPVRGSLVRRSSGMDALSGLTSYHAIESALTTALNDPNVNGILLDVDSGGGEARGCFELCDKIYDARQQKPVWAIANDVAYSAAYAIASSAEKLFVTRMGGVGSIGVITAHIDQSGYNAQKGLNYTLIYAGKHKKDGNPHEPLNDSAKEKFQERVDHLYGVFASTVARNRGLDEQAIRQTEALTYLAENAVTQRLADKISTFEEVLSEFKNTTSINDRRESMEHSTEQTLSAEDIQAEKDKAIQEALKTERERTDAIRHSAEKLGLASDPVVTELINSGASKEKAYEKLIAVKAEKSDAPSLRPSTPDSTPHIDSSLPAKERAAAEWDAAGGIDGFIEKGDYLAFVENSEKGLIKVKAA